jgi:hypothetical protein
MAAGERMTGSDLVMYWLKAQRVGRSAYEFVTTEHLSGMMHAASRAGIKLVMATVEDIVVRAVPGETRAVVQGNEVRAGFCRARTS